MGENSKIEWTDHTYNGWIGCTKVSAGCDHCYAEGESKRRGWAVWGKGQARHKTTTAKNVYEWNKQALVEGKRKRVFGFSLADVFDTEVDRAWRNEFWDLVRSTQGLMWIVLTKRPHLIKKFLPPDWGSGWENVCLMISAENQLWANVRMPQLIAIPAKYRGLSYEPALGPVKLKPEWLPGLHWAICGGESGGNARPMHPDWGRSMRDQCHAADIAFFFKQWGCWSPDPAHFRNTKAGSVRFAHADASAMSLQDLGKKDRTSFIQRNPQMVFMFRCAKKRAGHLLDGCKYQQHPFDLVIKN